MGKRGLRTGSGGAPTGSGHAAHDARADRTATLAHGETHARLESDGVTELKLELGSTAGLQDAITETQSARYVAHPEVELQGRSRRRTACRGYPDETLGCP